MRATISLSAFALILSLVPASAMCGGMGGQQAQSSGQGGSSMSCGRPAQSTQAEDPFGLKVQPNQKPQQMGMMCPCCRNMAGMMQGGGMKMDGDDPHKGMDMTPKQ
ncbi:hypothetical protein [Pseudorhodoplanes sp.]|uniref:hypothetical protein n=1 Tax=Pseudorhodoplanes sp. TaxID=1934341 RepID=UPI003D0ECA25